MDATAATDTATENTAPPPEKPEGGATERPSRKRAPKSPEAQARGIAARALARKTARLARSGDLEALRKATEALEQVQGQGGKAEAPAQPTAALAPPPAAATPAPTSSGRGPAWPSDAATSAWKPVVAQVVTAAAVLLHGTRYALDSQVVEVEVCGKKVSATKADALVDALAPLAAKYLPEQANTPEAYAGVVLFAVFGAPALGHGMEKLAAAIEKRTAAAHAGAA